MGTGLPKVLSKTTFTILTTILALFFAGIHGWNRLVFQVTGLPTPRDFFFANWTFLGTLVASYCVPLLLLSLVKPADRSPDWPVREAMVLGAGIVLGIMFIAMDLSLPHQDIAGSALTYLSAFWSYPSVALKTISNFRARRWRNFSVNGTVTLIAGLIIFIVSWAIVFIE